MLEMQVLADDGFIMRRSRVVKYLFVDDIHVECFCAGWDYSCIELDAGASRACARAVSTVGSG